MKLIWPEKDRSSVTQDSAAPGWHRAARGAMLPSYVTPAPWQLQAVKEKGCPGQV